MDIAEPEREAEMGEEKPQVVPAIVRKQKGTYRLSDFIIQRTLGTGSFGRVHLGEWSSERSTCHILIEWLQSEANITSASTL